MPFVSKSQWRQCFAAARIGQRKIDQCKEFARKSKPYKSLPERLSSKGQRLKRILKRRNVRKPNRVTRVLGRQS